MNRRQQLAGAHAADVPERVLEHALLGGDLRRRFQMLQAAAAADAEMRAKRRHTRRTGAQNTRGACKLVGRPPAMNLDADELAGQGPFDEHRFAVDARDAAAFLIERGDEDGIRIHCLAAPNAA